MSSSTGSSDSTTWVTAAVADEVAVAVDALLVVDVLRLEPVQVGEVLGRHAGVRVDLCRRRLLDDLTLDLVVHQGSWRVGDVDVVLVVAARLRRGGATVRALAGPAGRASCAAAGRGPPARRGRWVRSAPRRPVPPTRRSLAVTSVLRSSSSTISASTTSSSSRTDVRAVSRGSVAGRSPADPRRRNRRRPSEADSRHTWPVPSSGTTSLSVVDLGLDVLDVGASARPWRPRALRSASASSTSDFLTSPGPSRRTPRGSSRSRRRAARPGCGPRSPRRRFWSSSACASASLTIRSISSLGRADPPVIVIFCSLPVPWSLAETWTMPLASMSKVTSIFGTPRGAGAMPVSSNVPSDLLCCAISRSPWKTWMRTDGWLSSAVVKISQRLVGMAVLRSMSLVNRPCLVSMPRQSGVTSMSRTSLRSPLRTPDCRLAPTATTSSGLTPLLGSLPPVISLTTLVTAGMRVEPPTRTTWSMSETLMPASSMTFWNGALVRSSRSAWSCARTRARDSDSSRWIGPFSDIERYCRLMLEFVEELSSFLACSAASRRRCMAILSLDRSTPLLFFTVREEVLDDAGRPSRRHRAGCRRWWRGPGSSRSRPRRPCRPRGGTRRRCRHRGRRRG